VHLTPYPEPDASLIDEQLSADMNALLRLVSLALSARNAAKIKVRQPLAELQVRGGMMVGAAIKRFSSLLRDELNVKRVVYWDEADKPEGIVGQKTEPNPRTLGPKSGRYLPEVTAKIREHYQRFRTAPGSIELPNGETIQIEVADLLTSYTAPDGWACAVDGSTEMLLDVRVTDELKLEGLARDIVRQVQDLRKKANLDIQDRIVLYLGTESPILRAAIEAHRDYIAGETLTTQWATAPLDGDCPTAQVRIEGQALTIQLRKA
jgi:isoleucyl-tRNA synthetase